MKKYNKTFTFQNVSTDKVASIIKKLNTKKASETDDIPNNAIKEFGTFFAEFLSKTLTVALKPSLSLKTQSVLKLFPFARKMIKRIKVTIDL